MTYRLCHFFRQVKGIDTSTVESRSEAEDIASLKVKSSSHVRLTPVHAEVSVDLVYRCFLKCRKNNETSIMK